MKKLLLGMLLAGLAWGSSAEILKDRAPAFTEKGVKVYRDLAYGARRDQADEGKGFRKLLGGWSGPHGIRCGRHRTGQNYDVYLPAEVKADTPVFLYVHGGTWSQMVDKDGASYDLLMALAAKGYVCCSMDYLLQNDLITGGARTVREGATFVAMLQDVDAMCVKLAELRAELKIDAGKTFIGGVSAGGHLSLLYAFDETNRAPLGLALKHPLPLAGVVDMVGPADFTLFRGVVDKANTSPIFANAGSRMEQLFKALMDVKADVKPEELQAALKRFSPVHQLGDKAPKPILAYAETRKGSGSDSILALAHHTSLTNALAVKQVPYAEKVFVGSNHLRLDKDAIPFVVGELEKIR